jgi:uncharacterized protein YraI
MTLRTRPARVVAAVGAVLAAGTTTFMALAAGTASADEPGRCTQNVNVREDPDPHAKIVALCERGKQVKIGDERDGFVHLEELGGWASKDYVKADDDAASSEQDADGHHADDAGDNHDGDNNDGDNHGDNHDGDNHDGDNHADSDDHADSASSDDHADSNNAADHNDTGSSPHATPAAGGGGSLGGLLG